MVAGADQVQDQRVEMLTPHIFFFFIFFLAQLMRNSRLVAPGMGLASALRIVNKHRRQQPDLASTAPAVALSPCWPNTRPAGFGRTWLAVWVGGREES